MNFCIINTNKLYSLEINVLPFFLDFELSKNDFVGNCVLLS